MLWRREKSRIPMPLTPSPQPSNYTNSILDSIFFRECLWSHKNRAKKIIIVPWNGWVWVRKYRLPWTLPLLSRDMPWLRPPLSDTCEGLLDEISPGLMSTKQASSVTQSSNKNSHNIIMEHITHIPYHTAASHVITYTSKHSNRILEGINKQQMTIVYLSPQIKLKIK
jgi:hypothetical protein